MEDPKRAELRRDLSNIIQEAVAKARDIEEAVSLTQAALDDMYRKKGAITLYPLQLLRINVQRVWERKKGIPFAS